MAFGKHGIEGGGVGSDNEDYAKKYARKGWKESVRAFVVATGLVGGVAEAGTSGEEPTEYREQKENSKQGYGYNEANVTASGAWADTLMDHFEEEVNKIPALKMNDEQKRDLAQTMGMSVYKKFVREYYFPTQGEIVDADWGGKERKYSEDDLKLLKNTVSELRKHLQELDQKYGTQLSTEKTIDQLNDVDLKINKRIQRLMLEHAQQIAD